MEKQNLSEVKPIKTLSLLLIIGVVLGVLGFTFPNGLIINHKTLHFFDFKQLLFASKKSNSKDISSFLALEKKTESLAQDEMPEMILSDSILSEVYASNDSAVGIPDSFVLALDTNVRIQYPNGDSTLLYPFFSSLDSLQQSHKLIRVLHIGDSQIEGDRITGYVRHRFQHQFKGCGPGWLPISEPVDSRLFVKIKSASNVKRYTIYGKSEPGLHNSYGFGHTYFKYFPKKAIQDSLNVELPEETQPEKANAEVSYTFQNRSFPRTAFFEQASLLYRSASSALAVNYAVKNQKLDTALSGTKGQFSVLKVPFEGRNNTLKLNFSSFGSPDLFGVCFDCKEGIAFDNIPLRGSSGIEFNKINLNSLSQQVNQMDVELIVLEFGVNVVPYLSSNYGWYETLFVKALQNVKKAAPGVPILVVSVSDMAKIEKGNYESYVQVPLVRDAQKNAAKRTGCAFWDLYETMGGRNSMVAWASSEPPLASKDFTHFSPKGAQVVGELLYNAMMREFYFFKKARKKENS